LGGAAAVTIASVSRIFLRRTLLLCSALLAANAQADVTFNVNTTLDLIDDNTNDGVCRTNANTCSLRAAIMQANHWSNPEFAIINLPAGIYPLTIPMPSGGFGGEASDNLNLTAPLTADQRIVINGASAATTIIDGGGAGGTQITGVFDIAVGRFATIARLTIRNGNQLFAGGAITNHGTLTLANNVLEANHANTDGGGIYNGGTLRVFASTLRANTAGSGGGGIYVFGATTIRDSTLSGNGAQYGGGIYNNHTGLYITNSTISQNFANTDGGGIFSRIAAFIYNTSVIGNDADHDRDQNGGIGGGIYADAGSRFVVVHSLIAANTQFDAPIYNDCNGALETYGRNMFGEVVGCSFPNSTTWGTVLLNTIGPLQDNGGPTMTHALLPGSQAINGSSDPFGCVDETGTPISADQRGGPRVVGPHCDAGAYEFGANVDPIFKNGFE
jgi:hypothetical protein